ncbi:MAG: 16S rRNA (guanine(527)-N(7))-methyltransferase RsmG [Lachnospiraceae bacterium]|nr:16S rRNA (guanine(527)-N(7))-methyltransferase RsmG [Lachnospiraceae bacterium]
MEKQLEAFCKDLDELSIKLNEDQKKQFMIYYELLVEWNSFMNLTAITKLDEVCKKHFVDSLSLIKANNEIISSLKKDMKKDSISMIDVGTGAGFPGIPLKIVFPEWEVTLLDSLGKRIKFLNEVIARLGLERISAFHGRAEDYGVKKEFRESFDLCTSRAVANLSTLSEYCIPFVKKQGLFIAYKSEKVTDELASANEAIGLLGGKLIKQIDYELPDSDIYRNLVLIQKEKDTSKKYPRKAGLPSKEPL